MGRHVTPSVIAKIKQWEGLRLVPYKDSGGVWTDGYGNTHNVVPGQRITQAEADADLRRNLASAESAVDRAVSVSLSDNQFGALVAFVFNVGIGAFLASTLLKRLNTGDYNSVPSQLARWNKVKKGMRKVPDTGLTNRRANEAGLWAKGAIISDLSTPAHDTVKPLMQSKTVQGTALTSVGALGSSLTDTATQFQTVADYSDTLKIVFILLMVGGIGLTLWGRVRLHTQEGI